MDVCIIFNQVQCLLYLIENDASRIIIAISTVTLQIVASLTNDSVDVVYNRIMLIVQAISVILA